METSQPKIEEIQREIFNIFIEIKKIIERHNLRYFAMAGTCLGAVRHKGFIPWDNDMDISMPESDYEAFFRFAQEELPPHLRVIVPEGNPQYRLRFSKVHNINTTCIEEFDLHCPNAYKGFYVDVMPLCGIPEDIKKYQKISLRYATLNLLTRRRPAKTNRWIKDVLHQLVWLGGNMLGNDFFYRKWYNYVAKFRFDEYEYVGDVWSFDLFRKNMIFPKDWFREYVDIPFEDTTVRCPVGWHEYLTRYFGNYMELPPENERVSHSLAVADLNRPYSYFVEKKRKGELEL